MDLSYIILISIQLASVSSEAPKAKVMFDRVIAALWIQTGCWKT